MTESLVQKGFIKLPGRKEPVPETVRGLVADYYCPICEPRPREKKEHEAIGYQHDTCIREALVQTQEDLALIEEVYNSPLAQRARKAEQILAALQTITHAIARNG